MADIIRVDHEALAKVAASFDQQANATAQMLQQVLRAMKALQNGGWMGRSSEAFFSEMDQKVIPAVRRLIEALAAADKTTKEISNMMKSADEEASSGLRNEVNHQGGAAAAGVGAGVGVAAGVGAAGGAGVADGVGGGNAFGGAGDADGVGDAGSGADGPSGNSGLGAGSGINDFGAGFGDSLAGGVGADGAGIGAGLGDSAGGLGMAADDINSLLEAGSSLWGNDGLLANGSAYGGDTLGNNFFPGDIMGSDGLSNDLTNGWGDLFNNPTGFGAGADYGLPTDWLSGVNDSLRDYMQTNYDDYGIPKDWLDPVYEGIRDDLSNGQQHSPLDMSDSDLGRGLESGSSGGSSGSGSGGGGDMGAGAPLSDSGLGGGSGGSPASGSGGGMGSGLGDSGLGSGMGGGSGSGALPNRDFNRPSPFAPAGVGAGTAATAEKAAPPPVRFAYSGGTVGGGGEQARIYTAFGSGGGGASPASAPQANLGLPISLAAVSPFLALFGKALKRKSNE
ncbi:MAG: WXG100 family type VII secretion target [Caldilineaceae bacterium]